MHLIDKHHADAIQRGCTKVFVHKTFFNFKCLEKKGKKRFGTVTFTDMECFQKPTVKQHTFQ